MKFTPMASALISTSPGPGEGCGFVDVGQDFGSAGLGDFDGLHDDYPAKVVKLARPDLFHPRIVLAGCPALPEGDGDDDGLVAALRNAGCTLAGCPGTTRRPWTPIW